MTQREVLIDPFSPKAVSDEWTSSNFIGTALSQQPCRYSPWLFLGGCLTVTKKLNLFGYHFFHLLMGITVSQLWAFLSQAVQGKWLLFYCIINISLARFCHSIFFFSVESCPSSLVSFCPRVQTSEGRNFKVVALTCSWLRQPQILVSLTVICLVNCTFSAARKLGKELWKRYNLIRLYIFLVSLQINPPINTF